MKTFHFCILGICLSLYALYVEFQKELDTDYTALCDISETVSCSKVFTSEQGKIWSYLGVIPKDSLLDQPNAAYGVVFYIMVILVDSQPSKSNFFNTLLVLLGTSGVALSLYLGYVLLYVLHDTCIVCFGSYVCNFVIFWNALVRYTFDGDDGKGLNHTSLKDIYSKSKSKKGAKSS
jgi:vitamin-K-epoxide reductase (warfarin-sensitive)